MSKHHRDVVAVNLYRLPRQRVNFCVLIGSLKLRHFHKCLRVEHKKDGVVSYDYYLGQTPPEVIFLGRINIPKCWFQGWLNHPRNEVIETLNECAVKNGHLPFTEKSLI
ncbi:MAG: hypothetical protein K9L31_03560 [Candidatus Pacebacteria bacterium]|nr:hypothetical protein [Candidatus Paceibacterota bacterium]